MHKMTLRIVIAGLLLLGAAQAALAAPDDASDNALQWLAAKQSTDGGFSNGFTPESDIGATADAVVAIASARQDASAWRKGGASPLDYLAAQATAGNVNGAGVAAKVKLAALATGQDPKRFGGADLIAAINADLNPTTHIYGTGLFDQALALLALSNAGQPLPEGVVAALVNGQAEDGSWSFSGDQTPGAGDTNTTSMAVQALIAAGERAPVAKALDYFKKIQNPDSGFTYQKPSEFGEDTDANSTALVIQALLAAGERPENWAVGGKDPMAALMALQQPSGAFSFNATLADENALATIQAISALNRVTFVEVRQLGSGNAQAALPWAALAVVGLAVVALGGAWVVRSRANR
jgi:hypothetical protein